MKKQALNNEFADTCIIEIKPHHQTFIFNLSNNLEIPVYVFNVEMHLVYIHLLILGMPMNYVRLPIYPLYIPNIFECEITEHFAS